MYGIFCNSLPSIWINYENFKITEHKIYRQKIFEYIVIYAIHIPMKFTLLASELGNVDKSVA